MADHTYIKPETIQFHANLFLLPHFHVELGDDDAV